MTQMRSASDFGEAAKTCLKSWWTTTRRRWRTERGKLLAKMKREVGKVAEPDHQVYISTSCMVPINNPQAQARWGPQALIFFQYLRGEKVKRKTRHSDLLLFAQQNHVSRILTGSRRLLHAKMYTYQKKCMMKLCDMHSKLYFEKLSHETVNYWTKCNSIPASIVQNNQTNTLELLISILSLTDNLQTIRLMPAQNSPCEA